MTNHQLHEKFEDTKRVIWRTDNTKGQKDKQWSTRPFTEAKDQVTRAPLKPGVITCALHLINENDKPQSIFKPRNWWQITLYT